ncbi:MAG: hypothetical protein ABIP94_14400, partial [Planctomycetota bacterium]
MTAAPVSTPTTWRALLCGLLLFALADVAVFRSGAYAWLAKPDSSAGWVVLRTRLEPALRPELAQPSILLLGDSSMLEAGNTNELRAHLGSPLVSAHNAGVPGSTPRVWPFLFSALEAPPGGYTLVVIGLREFDDDAEPEEFGKRAYDLSFLGPLLGATEMLSMVDEFAASNPRRDARLMALCQTWVWRRDLQDLCSAPWARYEDVRRQLGRLRWGQDYEGIEQSLAGV